MSGEARMRIEIDESAKKNFGVGHPFADLSVKGREEEQSDKY